MLSNEGSAGGSEPRLLDVRPGKVSLLDIDPDVAGGLSGDELEAARRALAVPTEVLARGRWDPPESASSLALGILLVEGVMVRELWLGDCSRCAELLGPGDLLQPWQDDDVGLLPWHSHWRVLEECTIAALGPGIARAAWRWPEVMAALTSRAVDRSRKQAIAAAIPSLVRIQDRMVVLFSHLAERWGQVTRDGIVVRVPLTHELIASLIGGRRPTVTTALSALRDRGLVTRPEQHVWLIDRRIHEELDVICRGRPLAYDHRAFAAA